MRETRGRLSSLDLAPEEAQEDILWALAQLNERKRSQADILVELNDRLAVKGCEGISKSAFNRKAVRCSAAARRVDEARALFAGIAPSFTPERQDETNLVIGELIKVLIAELLESDKIDSKGAMELAQAYVKSIQGQALSSLHREKLEAKFARKASEAIKAVGKARGLTAETVEALRAKILGVEPKGRSDAGPLA